MSPDRRSAWKTVLAAGTGLLLGLLSCAWLVRGVAGGLRWPTWARMSTPALLVALAGGSLWLALAIAGALIGLHRDALEERGIPYQPRRPREGQPSALRRWIRRQRPWARPSRAAARGSLRLQPGELVEIRPLPDILATLDDQGRLDGTIFMPEMAAHCGQRRRVFRRVDKLNDWVDHTGLRRLRNTVLLERVRCDGSAHGGCQASCHLRWKEAWLMRVDDEPSRHTNEDAQTWSAADETAAAVAPDLHQLTRRIDAATSEERWVCQSTELSAGTTPIRWDDPRHYIRDLMTRNIRPGPWLTGISLAVFNRLQRMRSGVTFPTKALPDRSTSPDLRLHLQPGEQVRVKRKDEILATLNSDSRNRGLWFDIEMMRYCGGTYRVTGRIERLITERTGQLRVVSNPCLILNHLGASGEYNGFCAQNEAIFWREIWLERVAPVSPAPANGPS